ncbi:HEPN domain-containing protein [Methylobacterium pseudosasicola]|uniref:HEPN domain-containing protein n=1 Tax=Methylobacterium pseudosasicola TaxID=582667 RepID=A0A1I4IAF8_9HYPH|nr:HEPN domain-containing protein [Methylobacterium pseudosasicola]SFL51067.1 HEPN domain-containing protein [Methylobacterium pseudosasicola]
MNWQAWKGRSEDHLRAAQTLAAAGHSSAAYYLAGLAVECALKARIARSFRSGTWPLRQFVNDIHTHDLSKLVILADLRDQRQIDEKRDPSFLDAWDIVAKWTIESRYAEWSDEEASDMPDAVVRRRSGVMPWIRRHW